MNESKFGRTHCPGRPGFTRISKRIPPTRLFECGTKEKFSGKLLPNDFPTVAQIWERSDVAKGIRESRKKCSSASRQNIGWRRPGIERPKYQSAEELISQVLQESEFYQNAGQYQLKSLKEPLCGPGDRIGPLYPRYVIRGG